MERGKLHLIKYPLMVLLTLLRTYLSAPLYLVEAEAADEVVSDNSSSVFLLLPPSLLNASSAAVGDAGFLGVGEEERRVPAPPPSPLAPLSRAS